MDALPHSTFIPIPVTLWTMSILFNLVDVVMGNLVVTASVLGGCLTLIS